MNSLDAPLRLVGSRLKFSDKMAPILRSPIISGAKRKIVPRRTRAGEGNTAESVAGELAPTIGGVPPDDNRADEIKKIVEQARSSVLTQFKEEAEAARELGRQRGLREGRSAGIDEAKQGFASEIARVRSIADKLPQAFKSGVEAMEDTLVDIAFAAICKILGNTAATREGIQDMVRQASAQVVAAETVVIRVHPSDLTLLRNAGVLETTLPSGIAVSWGSDKEVELGGCVVETGGGELDARLETQIQRLRAALIAARGGPDVAGEHAAFKRKKKRSGIDRRKKIDPGFALERRKMTRRKSPP